MKYLLAHMRYLLVFQIIAVHLNWLYLGSIMTYYRHISVFLFCVILYIALGESLAPWWTIKCGCAATADSFGLFIGNYTDGEVCFATEMFLEKK